MANVLKGRIVQDKTLVGVITAGAESLMGQIPGTLEFRYTRSAPEYAGEYSITPAAEPQILETAGKIMRYNVEIKPIPKEYGLVTYNQNREIIIT
jgi:hypothetical protein